MLVLLTPLIETRNLSKDYLVGDQRVAVNVLRVNKMRSGLPMLGIIGVGAVITMITIGVGAQARISQKIKSLGSNLMIIYPARPPPPGCS